MDNAMPQKTEFEAQTLLSNEKTWVLYTSRGSEVCLVRDWNSLKALSVVSKKCIFKIA